MELGNHPRSFCIRSPPIPPPPRLQPRPHPLPHPLSSRTHRCSSRTCLLGNPNSIPNLSYRRRPKCPFTNFSQKQKRKIVKPNRFSDRFGRQVVSWTLVVWSCWSEGQFQLHQEPSQSISAEGSKYLSKPKCFLPPQIKRCLSLRSQGSSTESVVTGAKCDWPNQRTHPLPPTPTVWYPHPHSPAGSN